MTAKDWRKHLDQWPGLKYQDADIEQMWVDFSAAEAEVTKLVGLLREALEGMAYQFAYDNDKGEIHTGGLSVLEEAFEALGWSDPQPLPTPMLCDEPGCRRRSTCGVPTQKGYRRICGEHYAALKEAGDEPGNA